MNIIENRFILEIMTKEFVKVYKPILEYMISHIIPFNDLIDGFIEYHFFERMIKFGK